MKSSIDKFKGLLESKCNLFKKMQTLILEQKELLEQNDIDGLNSKCHHGEEIVAALKDIDYEIARLESETDSIEILKGGRENKELKNLLNKAIGYAKKNEALTKELAGRLMEARQEIREKLDGTVTLSQINGYRPYSTNYPIYVDKRN